MGSDLPICYLRDLSTNVSYGYTESASEKKVGPHFLRITDIQDGSVNWSSVPYCVIDDAKLNQYLLKQGDIVVARTGNSTGENYLYRGSEPTIYASYLIRFRIDQNKADPEYVWYNMRSNAWWSFVNGAKTGSAQAGANAKVLGGFELPLPALKVQRAIAQVLRTLDDKIELNRQMNETLEAMAQALFKSWFVDFDQVIDNALAAGNEIPEPLQKRAAARQALGDQRRPLPAEIQSLFPNCFVFTDEMGWVPEGWEVVNLSELTTKISKGTTPRKSDIPLDATDAEIPFIKVKDITDDGQILIDGLDRIPRSVHVGVLKRSMLKRGDVLFTIAGTIGRCSIVPTELHDSNINQAVAFMRLKEPNMAYSIVQFLKSEIVQGIVSSRVVQAVQANFSLTELGGLSVLSPNDSILRAWDQIIRPIMGRVELLQSQNRSLASHRDTLLPKLLSGELRIPDAEKQVAEAV